jgi:soluble lytic murein transglycosylase
VACSLPSGLPVIPPGWTLTPGISPTPLATLTPTSTPTPPAPVRIGSGDHALFNGDYPSALLHYQTAYHDSSDPLIRDAAKWGEARVLYAQGRYLDALASIQTLITDYPQSAHLPQAYFLRGLANYKLDRFNEAAASWQTYLVMKPGTLDAYTQELRGEALFAAGNFADALIAYSAATQMARLDDGLQVDMKIADTQAKLGDSETAIATYSDIAIRATDDYTRAQVAYQTGLLYQARGQIEEAFVQYRLAVENYPLSIYSYLSLVQLVNASAEVSDLDRGRVDYFAGLNGADSYDAAIVAFDRFIAANPEHDGTPLYYRALSLRQVGQPEAAVEAFSTFITNYSSNPYWAEAWSEKADTQWRDLGLHSNAAQTLLDFVKTVPNTSVDVDYLMTAARIYELDNRLDDAANTWGRAATEYPGDPQASTAIFMAGVVQYRQGNFKTALTSFNQSLNLAIPVEEKARALLWIGKAQQKLGDASAALDTWQRGQAADPGGYYSERARDLLIGRAPFAPPATTNLTPDLAAERKAADAWVRLRFDLPANTDLSGPGILASDPRFIRGTELWQIGLFDDARLEFENLRDAVSDNAVDTYRLANYLLEIGLYRPAINAIRQTLTLAGMNDQNETKLAPPYFNHARYGLYYSDLVLKYAREENIDPLLLFSVIRQESLFEGFVHSTAGARGLMQIIPATGGNIAVQLGWPLNYTEDDLYRPDVSVQLGSHYLATNRNLLGGNLYAALAAYNGGPGNAVIWNQLAGDDPDLFLEVVRYEETRNYIRNIYEMYLIYRQLYGPAEQ